MSDNQISSATMTAQIPSGTVEYRFDENDLENLAELVGEFGWGRAIRRALSYAAANTDDMKEAFGDYD